MMTDYNEMDEHDPANDNHNIKSVPPSPVETWAQQNVPEGDDTTFNLALAFGQPFALGIAFWRGAFISILIGGLMGLVGLGFFNAFEKGFETWIGESYKEHLSHAVYDKPWKGESWWVGIMTAGGFLIGCIKAVPCFHIPTKADGLFAEVKDKHVDPKEAPGILTISCLSLLFGFSVGPEAALGTMGGALGTLVAERRNLPVAERHAAALNGMAGAMGSLFPSPILSVILIHELSIQASKYPVNFMDSVVSGCIAATAAWMVFVGIQDYTFLDSMNLPLALYDFSDFEMWYMGSAAFMGILGGVIGFIVLLALGLFRRIAQTNTERLQNRFGERRGMTIATILLPTVGGFLCGVIAWALPLTLGDGTMQLKYVITKACTSGKRDNSDDQCYDIDVLVATIFGKMATLAISLGFGCIGGQIFPCIYMGTITAMVLNIIAEDWFPITLAVPCMAVCVAGSFVPAPFCMVGIAILVFVLGSEMTAPVFLSCIISFLTICGTGCIQGIVIRQSQKKAAAEQALADKIKMSHEDLETRLSRDIHKGHEALLNLRPEDGSA